MLCRQRFGKLSCFNCHRQFVSPLIRFMNSLRKSFVILPCSCDSHVNVNETEDDAKSFGDEEANEGD